MSAGAQIGPQHRDVRGPAGMRRRARRAAGAAVSALLALTACTDGNATPAAATSSSSDSGSGGSVGDLQAQYEQVIASVLPSVVEIRSSTGLGSGVVYDDKGDIVTNAHVVGSDKRFEVLSAGSAGGQPATLVGSFPPGDLAVVRVTGELSMKPASFADSSAVRVGEIVLAMGNPLGLQATVTNGIVSATGRTVSEPTSPQSPGATLPNAIQTSAPINPGNSGGALVNLDRKVVGVPTLAAVDPEAGGPAPGIGFAIPSNQVKRIADQLVATGRVTESGRAALGVRVTTVLDPQGQPEGAGVVQVSPGGPAAKAGLRPGDIVVSVDGQETPTTDALGAVLAGLRPGQTVPVVVQRGGSQSKVQITLGELGAR